MKKMLTRKRNLFVSLFILMIIAGLSLPFNAMASDHPEADLSVGILSKYVWRGQELSRHSVVIEPSMTVSYKGFSANMWSNLDRDPYNATANDPSSLNETDLTLSYGTNLGPVGIEAGYIYYGLDGIDDSQEFYINLGVDTLLAPSVTVYKDTDTYNAWYVLTGISHSFEFTDFMSLDLSTSISYLRSNDKNDYPEIDGDGNAINDKFDNFHDGTVSVGMTFSFAELYTIAPSVSYVFPLSTDARNQMESASYTGKDNYFVYGGVTLSMAF